jgi:hypothetical protein
MPPGPTYAATANWDIPILIRTCAPGKATHPEV